MNNELSKPPVDATAVSAEDASIEKSPDGNVAKKASEGDSKKRRKPDLPKNFMEFVLGVYEGEKVSQESQKAFDRFNVNVSEEDRVKILSVAKGKDPDFKITLSLAQLVLEGSFYARSHEILLSYIENIVSSIEGIDNSSTSTIFQSWLYAGRGVSNTAGLFFDRIARIKDENKKQISKKKHQNILLIGLIWLYCKKELEFGELLAFYSGKILSLDGEAGKHIEPMALAFATSMVSSTKKSGFGYLLFKLVEAEKLTRNELRKKVLALDGLEAKFETSKKNNKEMAANVDNLNLSISNKEGEIKALKSELDEARKAARHASIHGKDDKEDLRVRLVRALEGGLADAIKKAKISNSRIDPNPKTKITDYQLDEALEILQKELLWLKS